MTAVGTQDVEPDFLSGALPAATPHKVPFRTIAGGILIVVATVALAVAVPVLTIRAKQAEFYRTLEKQLTILANGRVDVIETWLGSTTEVASRVVDSELFRLFAAEVDSVDGDISRLAASDGIRSTKNGEPPRLDWSLKAQLPFMQQVLTDFVSNARFISGHLIGRDGAAYVTSAGASPPTAQQQALAAAAIEAGAVSYGPVQVAPTGLVMDVYTPIFPPQPENDSRRAVAALLLTMPVGNKLAEMLAPQPLAEPGEQMRLMQRTADGYRVVLPGQTPPLQRVDGDVVLASADAGFGVRKALLGDGKVFAAVAPVTGPPWWVVQEVDADAARAGLWTFIITTSAVAALVVIAVLTAFGAFWWRLANSHNRTLAKQYQLFATRLHSQKRFLDSINGSIAECIGLKDADGTYRYVNPAFAAAVGREIDKVIGLDDAALFGKGTADRLQLSDRAALMTGQAVVTNEEVYIDSRLRHLQVSKVPFPDEDGKPRGIVSVTRDITESIEQQRRKDQAIQQMVTTLVRAVELRDPYLSGHSHRVAGFATEVAQRLGLGAEEVATVEIAAKLSQIGKLAVPRHLLTKAARLDEAKIDEVRRHVDHAVALLRDIDFELPVLDTIYQMHERLDGAGYPKGLKGEEIRMTARILGVCDVFCARIEPRSYRAGISAEAALEILRQNDGRYDAQAVAALRDVVCSVPGEKLIAGVTPG